jgi:hypothetical protein
LHWRSAFAGSDNFNFYNPPTVLWIFRVIAKPPKRIVPRYISILSNFQ